MIEFLISGGPVMVPIGLASIIGLAAFIERAFVLRRERVVPRHFAVEVESLIEQELCANAHGFLGSERSTWTGNVALEREALGRGRNQFFGAGAGAGGAWEKTLVELRA